MYMKSNSHEFQPKAMFELHDKCTGGILKIFLEPFKFNSKKYKNLFFLYVFITSYKKILVEWIILNNRSFIYCCISKDPKT